MEGSEKYHLPSRRGLGGGALPSEGLEFPFLCYWGLTQGLTLGRRALSTSLYLQPRTWVSWGKILELPYYLVATGGFPASIPLSLRSLLLCMRVLE